jgi:hypothetical protein
MWRVLVLALVLAPGCATSNPRFTHDRIPVSALCSVTLIRDRRTEVCFMAYDCGWLLWRTSPTLVPAPREVCIP